MTRIIVRVRAGVRGIPGTYRDLHLVVDEGVKWLVLTRAVCRELGIETPTTELVVTSAGQTVDCETGIALIELPGRLGATLVRKFDDAEPRIGSIALGSLGIKVDRLSRELVIDRPVPLVRTYVGYEP